MQFEFKLPRFMKLFMPRTGKYTCERKVRYGREVTASKALAKMEAKGVAKMEAYECEWHQVIKLRDRAAADPSEWPEDLRVQEFPRIEGAGGHTHLTKSQTDQKCFPRTWWDFGPMR